MAGIGFVDAAAKLRAAPAVKVIEHGLADELALQAHGKIHRQAVFKVPPGNLEEAPLLHGTPKAPHIVIAPHGVALRVQHQGVVGRDIRLLQRCQGQPLRL